MRIAVLADVHSNVFALKAALAEIQKYNADKLVFLGDLVGCGAFPEETVTLARAQKNALFVMGNHDLFAFSGQSPYRKGDIRDKMTKWQGKVLSSASKEFLRSLPESAEFFAEGKKIVCMHYPKGGNGWFKLPVYLPTKEQVLDIFKGVDGDVILFGHEHTGSLTEYGGRYFLNFGTCGNFLLPNAARFGIVDVENQKVVYKSINAEYDDTFAREKRDEILKILRRND